MESIFALGILLSVVDKVTAPATRIGQGLDSLRVKAEGMGPAFENFRTYGLRVATAGALMIHMLSGTVMATVGTQAALGELTSVGVKDLAALERAGMEFSNQWSGTTKAQFIAAAYDIKGGIATLSDAGVAEFAKLAALTGKATKSSTGEMTSLFATAYGIYKDQYGKLTDMQFGQMFSGGIASAVNIFKSTGSGMAGAIENLGAAATVAKRPLEEQLTVLGMLQATMSGREAGTAYKAFIRDVDAAGKKLGMNFYDAAGNLKGIDQIMGMLRGKFGDLSGKEGAILQKAFTDESYRLVAQMYTKVGDLTGNIKQLSEAMGQGTVYTEQMASAMNKDIGAGIGILGSRWHNLKEILGKQLIPILAPLFTAIGNGIVTIQQFAEQHGTLTRAAMIATAGLAILSMGGITGALKAASLAAWGFTRAILTNPVTWIVVGVVALVAALVWLYNRFEAVRTAVSGFLFFLGFLAGSIWKFKYAIMVSFLGPLGMVVGAFLFVKGALAGLNLFDSGARIIGTIVDGIKSRAAAPVEAIKEIFAKIRNLLPFSDAKEGPLSQLTLSGTRIMSTLGAGITGAAPGLQRTMATALAGAALSTSVAVTPAVASLPAVPPPAISAPTAAPASAQAARQPAAERQDSGRRVVIQIGKIELAGVTNAQDFIAQLQALVEAHDAE